MSYKPHTFYHELAVASFSGILRVTLVHPLDLVKVRMQLYPEPVSTRVMAGKILRCEGLPAMFNGLSAALLRHAMLTTTRIVLFYAMFERFTRIHGEPPSLANIMSIGLYSSMLGAVVGNPSEVALIRMLADGRDDPCSVKERRKTYNGAFHALYKIASNEGFWSLWRGTAFTLVRTTGVGIIHIFAYIKIRMMLEEREAVSKESSVVDHTYAAFVSSFFTALITLPVDTMKTNYQIRVDDMSQREYFLRSIRGSRLSQLWQGFLPYFARLTLNTTFAGLIYAQVHVLFKMLGVVE